MSGYTGAPLMAIDADKATVLDESIVEKIRKSNLSASLVTAMEGCRARWVFERFIADQVFDPVEDDARAKGSLFHKVMEMFFKLPASRRTPERMRATVDRVLAMDDYEGVRNNADVVSWLRDAINGYYQMGADPMRVEVPTEEKTTRDGRKWDRPMLETRVGKSFDWTGRRFVGYIDRVSVDPSGGGLVVEDYKGLALDTPIPTPTGFTTMGEIRVGDQAIGSTGKPVRVLVKSEVHHRPCYRLSFDNGDRITCDNVHLWAVYAGNKDEYEVVDADRLFDLAASGIELSVPRVAHVYPEAHSHRVAKRRGGGPRTRILSVERMESVPTQCIAVSGKDHLYLCGDNYTVTHNTGGKVKRYKKTTKSADGLPEARQQTLYSMMLEEKGHDVTHARLIYPVAREVVNVDVLKDEGFRARVIDDLRAADQALDDLAKHKDCAFSPSHLCAWCPLAKVCPRAEICNTQSAKIMGMYNSQPEPIDFGTVLQFGKR